MDSERISRRAFSERWVDVLSDRAGNAMDTMRGRFPGLICSSLRAGVASNASVRSGLDESARARGFSADRSAYQAVFGQRGDGCLGRVERLSVGWSDGMDAGPFHVGRSMRWKPFQDELPSTPITRAISRIASSTRCWLPCSTRLRVNRPRILCWIHMPAPDGTTLMPRHLDAQANRRAGSGVCCDRPHPIWARYLGFVRQLGLYPGSPALTRALLREVLALPAANSTRRTRSSCDDDFAMTHKWRSHERSGWEALKALLPPRERRGLVFHRPAVRGSG